MVFWRLMDARSRWARKSGERVRQGAAGFTLIELLIVIVILGLLAGIVALAVGAFAERAQVAACRAEIKTIETAVESYKAKNGSYPPDLQVLKDAGWLREGPPANPAFDRSTIVNGQTDTWPYTINYRIQYQNWDGKVVGDLGDPSTPVSTDCSQ